MSIWKNVLICAALLAAMPVASSVPQEDGRQAKSAESPRQVIEYFQPEKASVVELLGIWRQLYPQVTHSNPAFCSPRLAIFGGKILVKGNEREMPGVLAQLKQLDQSYTSEVPTRRVETFHYQVRHVPLEPIFLCLHQTFGGQGVDSANISMIEDRGVVIVRGTPSMVKEAATLIKGLDVPRPQVMVAFYIIRGTSKEEADQLVPADLSRDLSTLVPYEAFEILTTAFLPTDTVSRMEMEVDLADDWGVCQLQLHPQAYDQGSGALTFGKIEFTILPNNQPRRTFSTSTSIRRGQYTVLGAVGADPVFVVAQMR
jgi:hypothetical protein